MAEREVVRVGIAEYKVAQPPAVLITYGIGSCVAIALWDPVALVGGLAHVMLPSDVAVRKVTNPLKYVDYAIREMLSEIDRQGGKKARLVAKIAGGAHMFDFGTSMEERKDMGSRNVRSVLKTLLVEGISVEGQDTGGNYGRSVEFHLSDGTLRVRAIRCGFTNL